MKTITQTTESNGLFLRRIAEYMQYAYGINIAEAQMICENCSYYGSSAVCPPCHQFPEGVIVSFQNIGKMEFCFSA